MFLLVDTVVRQLDAQGQTLELAFEALDATTARIDDLTGMVRDRLEEVEGEVRRLRERLQIEAPTHLKSSPPPVTKPVLVVVGLYPNQFSQVLDHCRRQNVDISLADIVQLPKDTWTLPEVCHYAVLSQWSGQGWDEVIRKRNKTLPAGTPRTKVIHETKGLPMIAMKIGECISRYYHQQHVKL